MTRAEGGLEWILGAQLVASVGADGLSISINNLYCSILFLYCNIFRVRGPKPGLTLLSPSSFAFLTQVNCIISLYDSKVASSLVTRPKSLKKIESDKLCAVGRQRSAVTN